jgi:hypothetical protein
VTSKRLSSISEDTNIPPASRERHIPLDPSQGGRLAELLAGLAFQELDPGGVLSPATLRMLALTTLLQYQERLSDTQAAHALQSRPDWHAVLQLPDRAPALDPQVLCEFRQRLREHPGTLAVFERLIDRMSSTGLFGLDPANHPTAQEFLEAVCTGHRMIKVVETATELIEALATSYPEWFGTVVLPQWYLRYNGGDRKSLVHNNSDEQVRQAQIIGADLVYLLGVIHKSRNRVFDHLPEVQNARRVWNDYFEPVSNRDPPTPVVWRVAVCTRCKQSTHPN